MLATRSYELRDYQRELIHKIFLEWKYGNRRVLAQSPTGSGKTVLFSDIANKALAKGHRVLVVAHREELITQSRDKLQSITGQPVGIIKAGYKPDPLYSIQVASIQTLARRDNWPEAKLVIIDEAHHSAADTYRRLFDYYSESYFLGVTATPIRADGIGFDDIYDCLVTGWSSRRLTEAGHLCPFRLFAPKNRIRVSGVKVVGGEYDQRQLAQLVNTKLTAGDVVEGWQDYCNGKKTVVFCVSVEHSRNVAQGYQDAGIPAEHLDGETPIEERRAILNRFRTGETLILTNCGIVTEGFDLPDIEAVQILRPTRSLALHLQMLGRGLRPSAGKEHLLILDHTENFIFHGLADEEHNWSLESTIVPVEKWVVECPDCGCCFRPSLQDKVLGITACPNCGCEIEIGQPANSKSEGIPREINHISEDMEELDLEADPKVLFYLDKLHEHQQEKEYKPIWIYYRLSKHFPNVGLAELRRCGQLCGYKPGWAWHKWIDLQREKRKQLAVS